MFAKLFDHISVGSLVNALTFTLLLLSAVFLLPVESLQIKILGLSLELPSLPTQLLAVVIPLIIAAAFNEYTNRTRLFNGHNHLMVCVGFLVFAALLAAGAFEALVLLPIAFVFYWKLSQLVRVKSAKYLSFDIGLLIGFFSLLYPPLLGLYPLQLMLTLFQGKLSARAFMSGFLGLCAGVFFPAFVSSWFGFNLLTYWLAGLQKISLSINAFAQLSMWTLVPLALLLLAVLQKLPVLLSRANNMQRVTYSFWYLALVGVLVLLLFLSSKILWMVFLIPPFAWVISKVLAESSNKWFRDSLYLLLAAAALIQLQHVG